MTNPTVADDYNTFPYLFVPLSKRKEPHVEPSSRGR